VAEFEEPAVVSIADSELDIATRGRLRARFQQVAANPRVVVDLTGARYMDSTAIDELYRADHNARRLGGKLVIVARNQRIVRLMSIAGLTSHVTIVDSLAAAHEAFG
jgi:anti-anti-sigma factor